MNPAPSFFDEPGGIAHPPDELVSFGSGAPASFVALASEVAPESEGGGPASGGVFARSICC